MTQYEPFRFFLMTCLLVVAVAAAAAAILAAYSMSSDPVREELCAIAADCSREEIDQEQLESRLNLLVDAHGIDFLIADKERGDSFLKAGLEVQRRREETQADEGLSTEAPR